MTSPSRPRRLKLAPMKPREKPTQVATRSLSAIEDLCIAVARRLPGLDAVRRVEVLEPSGDPEGRKWRIGEIDIDPPLDPADRRRVEAALEPWRKRFRLATGDEA